MQGFKGGVATKYRIYTRLTNWLLNYYCYGNETRLDDCLINEQVQNGLPYCPSNEEVGVICYRDTGAFPWQLIFPSLIEDFR